MTNLKRILERRRREEAKAQEDYARDAKLFRQAGDKKSADLVTHIRREEREHFRELSRRLRQLQ